MKDGESKQAFTAMSEIKKLNSAEALKQVFELAREQYNYARNKEAQTMGWFVGQKVQQKQGRRHRKPWDTVGKILKVNSVKIRVDFGEGTGIYNCPKTVMESAM